MTRILLADDEELERTALSMILRRSGIDGLELLEASNGREAVELAREAPPDLAILDLRMPGMDGIEAARRLREAQPELPVLFLTAFETFDYAREAARIGVEDYLVKPAGPDEVLAAVGAALSRAADRKAGLEKARQAALDADRLSGLVELELRDDLGRGLADRARLAEYIGIRRLSGARAFCAAIRPSPGFGPRDAQGQARDSSESAAAAARRAAERAEAALTAAGWTVLAGHGKRDAVLAAFGGSAGDAAGVEGILSGVAAACRASLGLSTLAGASSPVSVAGPESVESALAAALAALRAARPERPVVVLAPLAEGSPEPGREPLVARALRMLDERRAEGLGLEEAAAELRVSPYHLSRVIKARTGEGFSERLARLRVERVKAFLSTGLYSVKEASAMSGFADPAYCARVFRRLEGMSPTEFRESATAGRAARPRAD